MLVSMNIYGLDMTGTEAIGREHRLSGGGDPAAIDVTDGDLHHDVATAARPRRLQPSSLDGLQYLRLHHAHRLPARRHVPSLARTGVDEVDFERHVVKAGGEDRQRPTPASAEIDVPVDDHVV